MASWRESEIKGKEYAPLLSLFIGPFIAVQNRPKTRKTLKKSKQLYL
jgi:hypothetical protein